MSEEKNKRRKKKDERKESKEVVFEPKTKSLLAREIRRESSTMPVKEAPYPLVPSKKKKEWYFARFLEFFKKLEICFWRAEEGEYNKEA